MRPKDSEVMTRFADKLQVAFQENGERQIVEKAFAFGKEYHGEQARESGEAFFTHPVAVAEILMDLGFDSSIVAAALLHDVIEDTEATRELLKREFSEEIAGLVAGVTKLDKITFKSKEEEQAENFRKMFFAMSKDIRVLLIKLADRLHNMRTIKALSYERQVAMARETLEIYAPLASRLGLSYWKCELEDLCLQVLHPVVYEILGKEIAQKRSEREEHINQICDRLRELLDKLGIKGEVAGRPKHFYSIYKKMLFQNKSFEQIYDLTAIRIIVDTNSQCYEIMGVIHTIWKPFPGRFKDYIALPKQNGYQSLHTTVMSHFGTPFEIQIRTAEMHKVAEFGIAAHWKYKENRDKSNDLDSKLGWLREMLDVQTMMASSKEFLDSFKNDLYGGFVYVFTPKGDVIELPDNSTPIDFAYNIHSEVGNKCVGAKVNKKIVPLETKLQTGDMIEIITSAASKGPSRDWLRFVKSTATKGKIRSFFKKQLKTENIKRGKEMLELESKHRGYNFADLLNPKWLNTIMQRYSISSLDDMYAAIGYGGFTVNQILLKLIDFYKKEVKAAQQETRVYRAKPKNSASILIDGDSDMLIRLAKCCNPIPGDNIIGFISRGRGVAVHRTGCPNMIGIEPERLINATWAQTENATFLASLQIIAYDEAGLLAKVSFIISELKMSIESLNARIDKQKRVVMNIGVIVDKIENIDVLIRRIQQIDAVNTVYRINSPNKN